MNWTKSLQGRWKRAVIDLLIIIACVALAAALAASATVNAAQAVDLGRYAGKWYEFARTPNDNQDNTPSRSGKSFSTCKATTATYTAQDADSLTIRNACVRAAGDGTTFEEVIEGEARLVDGSDGRKLKIAFGSPVSQFFQRLISFGGFNYWIYAVDEAKSSAPYRWAVISGPDRDFLFLLTRDRFPTSEVRAEILAAANAAGLPVDQLVFKQE